MNKISDLISMPVISVYESNYIGIIHNILFNCKQKKCKYLSILNENENIPKLIKISDIYKIGNDCIFIKNEECIDLKCNNDYEIDTYINPINMKTYDLSGELIGTSMDITVNKDYQIEEIILNNNKTIKKNEIFNIGKNIILTNKNTLNLSKFKPKTKIQKIETTHEKVVILTNTTPIPNEAPKEQPNTKILTDFRFLIGRILEKDIVALNGEVIARNGSVVNKDIVTKASSYGKLVDIARYSKKRHQ